MLLPPVQGDPPVGEEALDGAAAVFHRQPPGAVPEGHGHRGAQGPDRQNGGRPPGRRFPGVVALPRPEDPAAPGLLSQAERQGRGNRGQAAHRQPVGLPKGPQAPGEVRRAAAAQGQHGVGLGGGELAAQLPGHGPDQPPPVGQVLPRQCARR